MSSGAADALILAMVWGASILGAWLIGKRKDREAMGAVLGFLLGLLGLIIMVFVPRAKPKPAGPIPGWARENYRRSGQDPNS